MKTHACIHEAACSPTSLQNVPLKFDKQNLFSFGNKCIFTRIFTNCDVRRIKYLRPGSNFDATITPFSKRQGKHDKLVYSLYL